MNKYFNGKIDDPNSEENRKIRETLNNELFDIGMDAILEDESNTLKRLERKNDLYIFEKTLNNITGYVVILKGRMFGMNNNGLNKQYPEISRPIKTLSENGYVSVESSKLSNLIKAMIIHRMTEIENIEDKIPYKDRMLTHPF